MKVGGATFAQAEQLGISRPPRRRAITRVTRLCGFDARRRRRREHRKRRLDPGVRRRAAQTPRPRARPLRSERPRKPRRDATAPDASPRRAASAATPRGRRGHRAEILDGLGAALPQRPQRPDDAESSSGEKRPGAPGQRLHRDRCGCASRVRGVLPAGICRRSRAQARRYRPRTLICPEVVCPRRVALGDDRGEGAGSWSTPGARSRNRSARGAVLEQDGVARLMRVKEAAP